MAADFTQTRIDMLRRRWRETTSPHVSLQLADLYRQQGSLADAVEVLEGGLSGNPESVSLRVALGRYRMEAGDSAGAAATLRDVVESDPSHLVANKLLVKAYVLLGERQRARDRLDLYSLLNDSDPEIEALEKSVATGQAYFDAPRPAKAPEPAPFDLPGAPPGPAPDLARVPRPPAGAPTLRRSADGRILWIAGREPFPEAGGGLGDPRDWSALAAGGLFEAPPAARPNGRPAGDGIAAALTPRMAVDEEAAARRRADHVEIRLRSREAPTEELREAAPPPVTAQQPTEAPPAEPPPGMPPLEEPPAEEPPPPVPPIEEPPTEEPPTEELPIEEPLTAEPPTEELPTEELPTEELPTEELPTEEPLTAEPREEPIGEPPIEGLPSAEPLIAEPTGGPIGEPSIEEPPTEELPPAEPPIEEPPAEEPPVEEPDEPRPGIDEPEPERPPVGGPDEEGAAEEISLTEILEAEDRVEAETPRPTLTLARLYLEQGHLEEAEETFRAVLLREPGNDQARLGLAAAVERRFAPAPPAAEAEDQGSPAPEGVTGEELFEAGAMPEAELPGWPEVGGPRESGAAAGAMGSAGVTLDDEPELRLPRSDEEEVPAARAAIRRRIGILKTYLDGLRAARSAEGR